MSKDYIGYDELVDHALRGVVREALTRIADEGLVGGHQFYVTFRTDSPGVDIPEYLRDRYPDELTIVLQHQFWGLKVTETGFSVSLSFNKAPEHISVPFAALTRFADPGVKFGLQFQASDEAGGGKAGVASPADPPAAVKTAAAQAQDTEAATEPEAEPTASEEPAAATDKVVTLDAFRKK